MSKLLTTTIVASKWACGGRDTQLVNKDGTMCCLGFDAVQRGITAQKILEEGAALPSDFNGEPSARAKKYASSWAERIEIDEALGKLVGRSAGSRMDLEDVAVRINDSRRRMAKSKRVELLRPVFKAAGRRIRFIDDEQPNERAKHTKHK